jgi:GAF domain-containing protein
MRPVVIFCPAAEHAAALARLVESELKLPVSCVASPAQAGEAHAQGALIVSSEELPEVAENAYLLIDFPLRAHHILHLISTRSKDSNQLIKLNNEWVATTQAKQLVHLPTDSKTDLTDKEIDILHMLAAHAGQVVAREELLKNIWGVTFALDTHTLETHIYRLRNKFRELSPGGELIVAEAGGYRLAS